MTDDVEALRSRVAELEARNRALQQETDGPDAAPGRSRATAVLRSVVATLLITLSVILAPIAAVGTWAHGQLVDTDRFVQTFAPLAHEPEVQALVGSQVTAAIEANLDIDGVVNDLIAGIAQLDMPPRAKSAVGLLAAPAAEGVRSLIGSTVQRVVASEQFARLWEATLRQAHGRATSILQGDPDAALQLSADGALTLRLAPVIAEVKQALIRQGFTLAERIPEVDRSIPIVVADSLALVRTVYQLSVAAGFWLPWAVLGLLAAGVAIARQRLRALAWAGAGLTASFLLLAAGLDIGKRYFVATVSPSAMPATTAEVLFDQLTMSMVPAIAALTVLAGLIAVGAWLYGGSRPAVAIRAASDRGFSAVRDAADRNGLGTRGFGVAIDRLRSVLVVATITFGLVVIFLNRPATMGSVLGTLGVVALVLVIIELVRRPKGG